MHAVLIRVTVNDPEPAAQGLREQVVPRTKEMPGFVAGYWVRLGENQGRSIIVFESEEAAKSAAGQVDTPGDFVTIDSVEVCEVVANA